MLFKYLWKAGNGGWDGGRWNMAVAKGHLNLTIVCPVLFLSQLSLDHCMYKGSFSSQLSFNHRIHKVLFPSQFCLCACYNKMGIKARTSCLLPPW